MHAKAEEIIKEYVGPKLVTKPGYYSGLGITNVDINSDVFEKVYKGVKKEIGKEAATNFVQMVADIDNMTAQNFINTFSNLAEADWHWYGQVSDDHIDVEHRPEKDPIIVTEEDYDEGRADALVFVAVAHALVGKKQGGPGLSDEDIAINNFLDSENIRSRFLKRHKSEFTRKPQLKLLECGLIIE